jgi:hypothetical protein
LVLDGGVLLGGFLVEPHTAELLKQRMDLDRLIIRRAADMTDDHVASAVERKLAREIVVVSDCEGVTEAGVVAAGSGVSGVRVSLVSPAAGEYADASLSNSLDDLVSALAM